MNHRKYSNYEWKGEELLTKPMVETIYFCPILRNLALHLHSETNFNEKIDKLYIF